MSCALWSPPISLELTFHLHLGLTQLNQFIKCACKRVPKHNERSWENVNVLVPHIAALFKLLIAKANITWSWKEAKLTPIHKKGPVAQPGNYRMIAISGTLYRLYSNLLCSMIQDWCIQHNKILDTQYRFTQAEAPCNPYSF